jgi:hypothetical protein
MPMPQPITIVKQNPEKFPTPIIVDDIKTLNQTSRPSFQPSPYEPMAIPPIVTLTSRFPALNRARSKSFGALSSPTAPYRNDNYFDVDDDQDRPPPLVPILPAGPQMHISGSSRMHRLRSAGSMDLESRSSRVYSIVPASPTQRLLNPPATASAKAQLHQHNSHSYIFAQSMTSPEPYLSLQAFAAHEHCAENLQFLEAVADLEKKLNLHDPLAPAHAKALDRFILASPSMFSSSQMARGQLSQQNQPPRPINAHYDDHHHHLHTPPSQTDTNHSVTATAPKYIPSHLLPLVMKIYYTFIDNTAPLEVNVPAGLKRDVQIALGLFAPSQITNNTIPPPSPPQTSVMSSSTNIPIDLFDSITDHVVAMLYRDTFARFLNKRNKIEYNSRNAMGAAAGTGVKESVMISPSSASISTTASSITVLMEDERFEQGEGVSGYRRRSDGSENDSRRSSERVRGRERGRRGSDKNAHSSAEKKEGERSKSLGRWLSRFKEDIIK